MITSNVHAVAADLREVGSQAARRVRETVAYYGQEGMAEIKREASQPRTAARPRGGKEEGPRLITGNYVRSINMTRHVDAGSASVTIGTNAPQGRRLELGFHGSDSRGRRYDQPSYPHFAPGIAKVAEPFARAIEAVAQGLG